MGIKADAVPGRLNQLTLYSDRPGLYYGQCSEICGRNHSFIPIRLEVMTSVAVRAQEGTAVGAQTKIGTFCIAGRSAATPS